MRPPYRPHDAPATREIVRKLQPHVGYTPGVGVDVSVRRQRRSCAATAARHAARSTRTHHDVDGGTASRRRIRLDHDEIGAPERRLVVVIAGVLISASRD